MDIYDKLKVSDRRLDMFKATCFGPWLDIQSTHGDPLLIHLMLQTQFFPKDCPTDEMWFHIGGHDLRFGREEFCLLTGLRFGQLGVTSKSLSIPFRDRVFPHIPAGKHVHGSDVRDLFRSTGFTSMLDLDAVRICLLLLLEVGFMGRQHNLVVADSLLQLVEDLDSWNTYPWGSYIWALTHSQLKNALTKRIDKHAAISSERVANYSLHGFVFAFKIWIFEVFPIARTFATRQSGVIPRAVAWHKSHAITWDMCLTFLDVNSAGHQPLRLVPTAAEMETDWWKASRCFFDGMERPMKKSRVVSPQRRWSVPPSKELSPPRQLASPLVRDTTPEATIPEDCHQHHTDANSNTTDRMAAVVDRVAAVEACRLEILDMLRGLQERDRRQEHTVMELSEKVQRLIEHYEGRYEDNRHGGFDVELPSSVDCAVEGEVRAGLQTTKVIVKTEIPTQCHDRPEGPSEDTRPGHVDADVAESEGERSEMVRVMVCSGGAWEVVNKVLEYRPVGLMRRTLQLPLNLTYGGLMKRVARKLKLNKQKGFRMSYKVLSSSSIQCNTEDVIEMVDDDEVSGFIDVARNMSHGMVTLYIF